MEAGGDLAFLRSVERISLFGLMQTWTGTLEADPARGSTTETFPFDASLLGSHPGSLHGVLSRFP